MEIQSKILKILGSATRLEMLRILCQGPMTTKEMQNAINGVLKTRILYRESVYKSLEIMVRAGLLRKYYDGSKGLCYKVRAKKFCLNLASGEVSLE